MRNLWRIRIAIAMIIGIMAVAAFLFEFYPVQIFDFQFTALVQRTAIDFSIYLLILTSLLIALTFIFGRIYCSLLCPLGIYQELMSIIFRKKVRVQKNHIYKYFLAALVFGMLAGGTTVLVRLIDPYSVFGSAMSGTVFGCVFLVILAILVRHKGRLFCSNICPVGTVLGFISKHAINQIYIRSDQCMNCGLCATNCPTGSIDLKNKTVNNETCIKCFKCLSKCRHSGLHYGAIPKQNINFDLSRRRFLIQTAVLGVFVLAVKSGISISKTSLGKLKKILLPAGAENAGRFADKCLNCNLCVANCPMKIIKKANADYPAIHLDYQNSFCDYDCHKCSEVCPSGAIKRITLAVKQKTKIGQAFVDDTTCIKCGLCVMHCPRQIISREEGGFPQIRDDECIGCGTCASVCPVHVIRIEPVEQQKIL